MPVGGDAGVVRSGVTLLWRRAAAVTAYVVTWLVLSVIAATALFLGASRVMTIASHDAEIRPILSLSGPAEAVVHAGPVLPDVRLPVGGRIGVDLTLGKTDAASTEELVQRYAAIAGAPEGQEALVRDAVTGMLADALLRGAALGALPVLVWLLLGRSRRRELLRGLPTWRGAGAIGTVAVIALALVAPWTPSDEEEVAAGQEWIPLQAFLGQSVPLPRELDRVQVRGDVTTSQTRRLIESAISTYDTSKVFYSDAADAAADLPLRTPLDGETVALLVSDRHDNIGMDQVARAVADAAGATAVLDAGDDTSTGSRWEAFSIDSLDTAFRDFGDQRWAVTGNHDHGSFVGDYLAEKGWTVLDGEIVDGPGGTTLVGVGDPRSSGLGNWRDESNLGFAEVEQLIADDVCAAEVRVATVLVHDANLGREALRRGCVDLVVGGHVHVPSGPTQVVGENGEIGWTYTTGTTGGAAYAFALGSKPRRAAQVTLVTYAAGRPSGIQPVILETNGTWRVGAFAPLTY